MLNKCMFIGNVGQDPDIRSMGNGDKVANLSLGVTDKWKDKQGQRQERTEWVRISVFNDNLVKLIETYVKKGSSIYIEGKMQTRKWQDKDGNDKYTTEINIPKYGGQIVLLGGKSQQQSQHNEQKSNGYHPQNEPEDDIFF